MIIITRNHDYLMHHGIKGMKWGVRRFQNDDGTWKNGVTSTERLKGKSEKKRDKEEYRKSEEYKAKRAKAIKVGAAVAGTVLAAYGAKKISDIAKDKYSKQLADKYLENYSFIRSNVKTKEAVVGLAKSRSETNRRIKDRARRVAKQKEEELRAAQEEWLRKRMSGTREKFTINY